LTGSKSLKTIDYLIESKVNNLIQARSSLDSLNNQIALYFSPYKKDFFAEIEKDGSDSYYQKPFNESSKRYTGVIFPMLENFISFINDLICSPTLKWFKLSLSAEYEYEKNNLNSKIPSSMKKELADIEDYMFHYLDKMDFYNTFNKALSDTITFGYGGFSLFDSDGLFVRYLDNTSVFFDLNYLGNVNLLVFRSNPTSSQIINEFNKDEDFVPEYIINDSKVNSESTYTIINYYKDCGNGSYKHIVYDLTTRIILREEVWTELNFFPMRWIQKGLNNYGFGQPTQVLDDAMTLNLITRNDRFMLMQNISPSLDVDLEAFENFDENNSFKTGSITVRNSYYQAKYDPIRKIFPVTDFRNILVEYEVILNSIKSVFYSDLIQLRSGTKTATEVVRLNSDMTRFLQPIIMQMYLETIRPFLYSLFGKLVKNKKIKLNNLTKDQIKIDFSSQIIYSRQQNQITNIMNYIGSVGSIASSGIPGAAETMDNINLDTLVTELGDLYNVDRKIFNSDDKIKQIRDQRNEIMQQQMQLNNVKESSESLKNVSGLLNGQ